MKQVFESELAPRGPKGAWMFLLIPFDVLTEFGSKARVPVTGTLNGFPFRSSLMPQGDGTHAMMINQALRAGAKTAVEKKVKVTMDVDRLPRTVTVPADLKQALSMVPQGPRKFAELSYSSRKELVDAVMGAKQSETRVRRIQRAVEHVVSRDSPKG